MQACNSDALNLPLFSYRAEDCGSIFTLYQAQKAVVNAVATATNKYCENIK
jgi:predicted nucleic acid-binding Zn ribbon protein